MNNIEARAKALKALFVLGGICGLLLLACLYLIAAPFYGPESRVDLWSPVAETLEGANGRQNIFADSASDYFHFSLGSRPLDEIISSISTPDEAKTFRDMNFRYVEDLDQYGQTEYIASMHSFRSNGWAGDCEDFAIALAALLADDGYTPITLSLQKEATADEINRYSLDDSSGKVIIGHRIYLYELGGKFGSIGTGEKDDREPIYDSVDTLAESFSHQGYSISKNKPVKNLDQEFPNGAWMNSAENLK